MNQAMMDEAMMMDGPVDRSGLFFVIAINPIGSAMPLASKVTNTLRGVMP